MNTMLWHNAQRKKEIDNIWKVLSKVVVQQTKTSNAF
jgi:hypothetical protein